MLIFVRRILKYSFDATTSEYATLVSVAIAIVCLIFGARQSFSYNWQVEVQTCSAIICFVMVFLIAGAQSRDTAAIHFKLDLLIAKHPEIPNAAVGVELLDHHEFTAVRDEVVATVIGQDS